MPRKKVFKKIRDSREWSEINIISFVLDVLNRGCIFFDENLNQMYCGARGPEDAPTCVLIMWEDHSHFRSIRCGDQGEFDRKGPVMQHLMQKDVCPKVKKY